MHAGGKRKIGKERAGRRSHHHGVPAADGNGAAGHEVGCVTAEEHGDASMLSRVASQVHTNLELTAKLLGDLGVGGATINNVLVMPAYVEMRVELVRALAPFPEARQAVAAVLHQIEHNAADGITAEKRDREFAR